MTLSQFRDHFGTSRKYAQAALEHMDRLQVHPPRRRRSRTRLSPPRPRTVTSPDARRPHGVSSVPSTTDRDCGRCAGGTSFFRRTTTTSRCRRVARCGAWRIWDASRRRSSSLARSRIRTKPLSPFATAMHEGWGLDSSQVIASRHAEERCRALISGRNRASFPFATPSTASTTTSRMTICSAIPPPPRQAFPAKSSPSLDLPDDPDPQRPHLRAARRRQPRRSSACVSTAAVKLADSGWDVWFYEDVAVRLRPASLEIADWTT